eukprot:Lithocolla_globosa_v1_NODE_262_length_4766_cov_108.495648.p5 type:complete len:108 gc:universal NODE_262_length_4766_cov_108.495648:3655-3978(+)
MAIWIGIPLRTDRNTPQWCIFKIIQESVPLQLGRKKKVTYSTVKYFGIKGYKKSLNSIHQYLAELCFSLLQLYSLSLEKKFLKNFHSFKKIISSPDHFSWIPISQRT